MAAEPDTGGTQGAARAVERLVELLAQRGYAIAPGPAADVTLQKRGHSVGPFLPYIDFVAVHDRDGVAADAPTLESLHEANRAFADARFRLPPALRYRIPVTITIAVTSEATIRDDRRCAKRERRRSGRLGGEKDSVFLIDLAGRELFSAGYEQTGGRYGPMVSGANPNNRVHEMMLEVAAELFDGQG